MIPREQEQMLLRLEELWLDPDWDRVHGYQKPPEDDPPGEQEQSRRR